jgi:ankyrin repeat protein
MEMCRFSGLDDVEYRKVARAIDRVLEGIARLTPPDAKKVIDADQRQRILDCLRFDQIDARHTTIKTAHVKTCKWLLNKPEYRDWLDVNKISNHHGFLWIKGKPGTGKSTMMKFAFANAKKIMKETIIVSFFFNARGDHLEKSASGIYRSLLFQLLEKVPDLQTLFDTLPLSTPTDFDRWDIEVFKNIFALAIENLGQRHLLCFIDALDECDEDQAREMIASFERLGQFAMSAQIQFHVCFSSRHYPHITIEKGVHLILEGQEGHTQDIVSYLHSDLKAGRGKLIEQIKEEILERSSGIFLWVVLVVQILNKEFDHGRIHALRQRLDEIPNGLDELFQDILTRDGHNIEELILCLQWILYAERPMNREELYFAILAGVAAEGLSPWDTEEITEQDMERFVLSSSKGLAETTKSKHQTVQFIHESVRDFLLIGNGLNKLQSHLDSNFPGSSHERLKECCQSYMRIDVSKYLPSGTTQPAAFSGEAASLRQLLSDKLPFLEYAVGNVLYHADAASEYGISQVRFVENFNLIDWINLDNLFEKFQIRRHTTNCSLLYILAEKDLPNLIQIELKRVQHMDIRGERYGFPLNVALAHKNENAVRALLSQVGTWYKSDNSLTVSSSSTVGRHQESIKSLLECAGDIGSRKDQTPLSWAAERGNEAVVRRLLETGQVDVDLKDPTNNSHGRTPLSWAAAGGHEVVVQLLLDTGQVDADSKAKSGRTPLSWAAAGGHEVVVQLLLDTGQVDADSKAKNGRTPHSWAAEGGHEAVVRLLLETGQVNVDSKDSMYSGHGRTPLSYAAMGGHKAVVRLLLETGKVGVDSRDVHSFTPLLYAAAIGHEAVVRLLLESGQVSVDYKGNRNWTPFSRAAKGGHEAIAWLLLETGQVDVNSEDYGSQTPLSWAAEGGHEAIVRLLLESGQVEVDSKDNLNQTPFSKAVKEGYEAVAQLLLETGQVNVKSKDDDG